MPDTAIAAQVNPPSLSSLSSILGIQQQRQALTQQALDIQRSQIETQAQQGANNFFQSWDPGSHHGEDGTLDLDSAHASPQYQALTGAARLKVESSLNQIRAQQLSNKASLATIDANAVGRLGQVAQAAANAPDQAPDLFDAFAKQNPENARAAGIYVPFLKQGGWNPRALGAVAAQASDVVSQQPKQVAVPTAQGTQLTTFTPQTSAVTPSAFVKRGVGPTETPEFQAAVAARQGLGTGGAADINQHYGAVQADAQRAETFTGIARNVQDFAHQAITGTPEKRLNLINGILAYAGLPAAKDLKTASDLLEKNMVQLNLQGNTATDFRTMVTQMAQPHMTMSDDAIKRAAGQLIGQVQMKKAIGTSMTNEYNHAQATGDQNLYRAKRDAISNIADARVWEFNSLTPKEQKQFRANLSPQDDQELGVKYKAAKALGLLNQPQ